MRVFNLMFIIVVFILIIAPPIYGQDEENELNELSAAEVLKEYGNSVVLIVGVRDEGEVIQGTGFLVTSDGVIVSNYHVVKGAYPAIVKLANGDVYDNIYVREWDARKDLAIIEISGFNLPTAKLGDSDSAEIGEKVVVIGNPLGLEQTISDGLLSGLRELEGFKVFQISAPISGGSSGSPVFNNQGEVIGVAYAVIEAGQNLNFSIPINYARGLLESNKEITLKEFSKLDTEPLVTNGTDKPEMSREEALTGFGQGLTQLFGAKNYIWAFRGEARTRGYYKKKTFDIYKWHAAIIPSELHTAQFLARKAKNIFQEKLNYAPKDIKDLSERFGLIAEELDSSLKVIFETAPNRYSTDDLSRWGKAWTDINDANMDIKILVDELGQIIEEVRAAPEEVQNAFPYRGLVKFDPDCGFLGAQISDVTGELVILGVYDSSPAEGALKKRDILKGVDGGPEFSSYMDCFDFLNSTKPGQKVKFRVIRGGKEKTISVKLTKRPDELN